MTNDDRTRKTILARRARFVAAALTGIGVAGGTAACSSEPEAQACLSMVADTGGDDATEAAVCLSVDASPPDTDTDAAVCLTMSPPDADADVADDASDAFDGADTEPTPCLKMAPDAADDG
jgi:hypothetical protein